MFQESEIINLLLAIFSLAILTFILRRTKILKLPYILPGFYCILGAYFFTVIEGIAYKGFFNLIEHACYASSGVFFALGCWVLVEGRHIEGDSLQ